MLLHYLVKHKQHFTIKLWTTESAPYTDIDDYACFTRCSNTFQVRWKICRCYMHNLLGILYIQNIISLFLTKIFQIKFVDVFGQCRLLLQIAETTVHACSQPFVETALVLMDTFRSFVLWCMRLKGSAWKTHLQGKRHIRPAVAACL